MRVDHTNIEEVLFDYVEGNLNHQQSTTLFEFLEKNPEYQGDLDAWQATIVNDDTAQYERADHLIMSEPAAQRFTFSRGLVLGFLGLSLSVMAFLFTNSDQSVNLYTERALVPELVEVPEKQHHHDILSLSNGIEKKKVYEKKKTPSSKHKVIKKIPKPIEQGAVTKIYLEKILAIPASVFMTRHNTAEALDYRSNRDDHIFELQMKVEDTYASERKRKMKLRTILIKEKSRLGKQKDVVPMDQFGF